MEDTEKIAIFHYRTEQNIRALSLYGGNIKKHLVLPPLWCVAAQHLREIFLKRAVFLEESGLHEYIDKTYEDDRVRRAVHKLSHGYGRFFVKLYWEYYEGSSSPSEAISLSTFTTLVNDHMNQANIHPHPQTEQRPLPELPDSSHGQDRGRQEEKPATHETTIKKSLIVLDHLASLFVDHFWHHEITNLRNLGMVHPSEAAKTLIGVIGTPDSNKTAVVNAIIGAELLTDTDSHGMGITTTVAYNTSQHAQYFAEIDFLTGDEWEAELRLLLGDITDVVDSEDEVSSEAARAMDKLCAVYACNEDEVLGATVDSLLQKRYLSLLDECIEIQTDDLRTFIAALDRYRPPSSSCPSSSSILDKGKRPMQVPVEQSWPLVREIRIFTKAEALSTGATLMNLPTAHDSNRARVTVTERYMKQCDVYWIVAPVNQAVDEYVARDLLGDLRLQLHLDGGFGDLVFVCTETGYSGTMCEKKETCINLKKTIRDLKQFFPSEEEQGSINIAIRDAQQQKKVLENEINAEKAATRHEYAARHDRTKNALKHDFVQGLFDFYHSTRADELLMLEAGGWSRRDQEITDNTDSFRALGMHLPVFCLDTDFPSRSQDDLEQLQSLCHQFTDGAQWQAGVRFLMHVRELLAAIALWASSGFGVLTDEDKCEIQAKFSQSLDSLEDDVEASCSLFTKGVVQSLTDNILDRFGATAALVCELDIWDGVACDLPVHAYQAVYRRHGVFGCHNWNQDLANLAIRPLVPGWKHVFETDIALELEWLARLVKNHVYAFHQRILSFIDDEDCDDSRLWATLYSAMKHEMNGLAPELRAQHRQLNRDFAIGVEQALQTAYADGDIHTYSAYYIYTHALDLVRKNTLQLVRSIEQRLALLVDALVHQTGRHYRHCMITPLVRPFTLDQLRLKNDAADVVLTAQRQLDLDRALADELGWEDARERFYQDVLVQRLHQQSQPRRRRRSATTSSSSSSSSSTRQHRQGLSHSRNRPLRVMGHIQEV